MAIIKGHRGKCFVCGNDFALKRYGQKACSYTCGYQMQNAKKKRGITNFGKCGRCGVSLNNKKSHAIYCSKTCKSMDHTLKHRSKTRTTGVARRREIFERDNGQCYLCAKKLDYEFFELDHLIPVNRNGNNASSNLAVSCQKCNRSRGTRIGIEQLQKLHELGHNFD